MRHHRNLDVARTAGLAGAERHVRGLAAEAQVARHYQRAGHQLLDRRWRGRAGEIDLIARAPDGLVFIEVKAGRDLATAAWRLTRRQMHRLVAAAEEYVGALGVGLMTPLRFDVALVDRSGRMDIIENALVDV